MKHKKRVSWKKWPCTKSQNGKFNKWKNSSIGYLNKRYKKNGRFSPKFSNQKILLLGKGVQQKNYNPEQVTYLLYNRATQINKKYITHKDASERIEKKAAAEKKNYLPAPSRYVTFSRRYVQGAGAEVEFLASGLPE